ncbi:MAG: NAD(P)/FAD-dependent oxidoreductase [Clostridia bacterium]|nr:NAD(P)/FAD-dependent oxidoreductase [Clostridia bacterium]
MDNHYDVIVVGAGNAGLVAAATTAKSGLKTLLLEKHNLPGGSASSFVRGRFEFEPSLHELAGVGTKEKPGNIYQIFDELGAKIDWRYEYNTFRTIAKGVDGYDVKLPAGIDAFCTEMEKAVPGCEKQVRALFALAKKVDDAIAYITKMKGKPNPLVMITKHGDFMRVASHSVEQVMDALGLSEKARDILCTYWGYLGVPTDEVNCMHYLAMLNSFVVNGAAMPYKRSHEMSLALVKVINDNGGEVWFNSEVTRFLYDENGAAIGVEAAGKKLYAKEIISNIIPHNVFNRSDADKIPQRDLKLANARKFGISVLTVYLGLDCTMEELGIKDYTVFVTTTGNTRKQYNDRLEGSMYIVNCLNDVIPDCTPKGTCSMFFTMPLFGSDIPKELKPEQYKKYKNDLALRYLRDYEDLTGMSIVPHIEEISVATPVTFARYLGTPEGTIYGYMNSGWDNMLARISSEKEDYTIPNLTFCGGHSARSIGYSSTYNSGKIVGDRIVRKLKGGN